jgi:hypothetical protein
VLGVTAMMCVVALLRYTQIPWCGGKSEQWDMALVKYFNVDCNVQLENNLRTIFVFLN